MTEIQTANNIELNMGVYEMSGVKFDQLLYGGDYNPEQWLDNPEILKEDIRMMKKACINTVSLGIFAWSKLEPREGVYNFEWLSEIIDRLYENGISVNLATPSGARPHWLADRYPEVLRVNADGSRNHFGMRHNHCYTSPVYRNKVRKLNQRLAARFDSHPGVILWHVSNEYGGECYCPLCQQAFREWLKKRYGSIEELNRKWYTAFWSHAYDNFDQVEPPMPTGESSIHGLYLDWKRFVSDQVIDFFQKEVEALREAGAKKPVTTNFMYQFKDYNYYKLAQYVDVVSWDNYPTWHRKPEYLTAMDTGMQHDMMRSMKKAPFLLMESCPAPTNWQPVNKLRRPGMVEAASLQAIAHGSDSVMYFQIRKGRGGFEKFHGAVIDHYGKEDDRTYQECCQVGENLIKLSECNHTSTKADVAVIFDWENWWAIEESKGPRNQGMHYQETVEKSYYAFRKQGLNVDLLDMEQPLEGYRIIAAPMVYMFRAGFENKVRKFVEEGGIFILTYWSGVVDENDLCFLGGTPGGLMDVMGLRSTEIDGLYDGEKNQLCPVSMDISFSKKIDVLSLKKIYSCEHLCQLVNVNTAMPLMVYGDEFYQGTPALTVNQYGKGKAYYVCADAEQSFYDDFYCDICREVGVNAVIPCSIPKGVEVTTREEKGAQYIFIQNFNRTEVLLPISSRDYEVIFHSEGAEMGDQITLQRLNTVVLKSDIEEMK